MNETSKRPILVWDLPVRVFHWLLALSYLGAYVTAESERWRTVHVTLGYTMAGLIAFRLAWGLFGTRHARFATFVRRPRAVIRYLGGLLRGKPEHFVGHNPAGALAIVVMIMLGIATAVTGWATYNGSGHWLEELHEGAANAMLAMVGVHIVAVAVSSWLHRENLVGAMLTGRKQGRPEDGIRRTWRTVAAMMLVGVLGFWWTQWQGTRFGAGLAERAQATQKFAFERQHRHGHHD
jgi:cytochrome b